VGLDGCTAVAGDGLVVSAADTHRWVVGRGLRRRARAKEEGDQDGQDLVHNRVSGSSFSTSTENSGDVYQTKKTPVLHVGESPCVLYIAVSGIVGILDGCLSDAMIDVGQQDLICSGRWRQRTTVFLADQDREFPGCTHERSGHSRIDSWIAGWGGE